MKKVCGRTFFSLIVIIRFAFTGTPETPEPAIGGIRAFWNSLAFRRDYARIDGNDVMNKPRKVCISPHCITVYNVI